MAAESRAERRAVLEALFPPEGGRRPHLGRMAALMTLSVVIAALGLIGDSAAVVIGAMLVAPLMSPIIALAASLVLGLPRRQLESLSIAAGAAAYAVGLSWVVAWIAQGHEFAALSQQLLERTEPRLLDLGIAVAAGAAGAYVTVRSSAAAALPGVAIAVALVPPLAACGVLLEFGEAGLAGQAALLFATNFAAIVLAGAVVFLAAGFRPAVTDGRVPTRVKVGIASAAALVLAVAYPLADHSRAIVRSAERHEDLSEAVDGWLTDPRAEVVNMEVEDEPGGPPVYTVDVVGPAAPPAAGGLARILERESGHGVRVVVRWTRQTLSRASAGEGGGPGGRVSGGSG